MSKGQKLLDFLTNTTLLSAVCSTCEARDGFVFVWSSGSAEQLDAFCQKMIDESGRGLEKQNKALNEQYNEDAKRIADLEAENKRLKESNQHARCIVNFIRTHDITRGQCAGVVNEIEYRATAMMQALREQSTAVVSKQTEGKDAN